MREMKDSGVPWIGEIPKEWMIKPLSKIACEDKYSFVDGPFGSDMKTDDYVDEGTPIIQLGNITPNHHKPIPTKFITEQKAYSLARHSIYPGDIAMAKMMPSGKAAIVSDQFGQYIIAADVIRIKVSSENNNRYICYCINACASVEANLGSAGATRSRINLGDGKKLRIIVPSLREQERIADFLDSKCAEVDSILEKTRASIEEYKKLKQSVITEAVTKGIRGDRPMKDSDEEWTGEIPAEWTIVAIKTVCNMKAGKNLTTEQILEEGPYPVYGGNGIRGYYNEYLYDGECLLVGRQGALCGNVHRVIGKFWPTEHAVVTTPTKGADIGFLYHALVGANLNQYASDTAAQPGLSVKVIQNVRIPMAPNTEQQEIAAYLDEKCAAIDSLIASKEALITELETYKKSLIYEYVTGKKEVL